MKPDTMFERSDCEPSPQEKARPRRHRRPARIVWAWLVVSGSLAWPQQPSRLGDVTPLSKEAMERVGTVSTPDELRCLGFIRRDEIPVDMFIAGLEQEGLSVFAAERNVAYLNGRALESAKVGERYRVVRPEGVLRQPLTRDPIGTYYRTLGTLQIQSLLSDSAIATVHSSCDVILKGDIVIPEKSVAPVKFTADKSDALTPYPPQGLGSTILIGYEDLRFLGTGQFCFIGVGARDGVKPGDRFTIYRPQPRFDPKDLILNKRHSGTSYQTSAGSGNMSEDALVSRMEERLLPYRVMGDLVVVDVEETTAAAKIIFSRFEIAPGDLVVRR